MKIQKFLRSKGLVVVLLICAVLLFIFNTSNELKKVPLDNQLIQSNTAMAEKFTLPKDFILTPEDINHLTLPERCENYLLAIEEIEPWRQEKFELIDQYYQGLIDKGLDPWLIDHISLISGVGILDGRDFIKPNNGEFNLSTFLNNEKGKTLNEKENNVFQQLLEKADFNGLVDAYSNNKITLNKKSYSLKMASSPITQLLTKYPIKSQDVIFQLIELGLKPTFNDLKTATNLKLSIEFVSQLYQLSGLDVTGPNDEFTRYESLTTFAIKARSPELLEFWLSVDSPANPDVFDAHQSNALDLIMFPKNEQEKAIFLDIFLVLMQYGVKPTKPVIPRVLDAWLPKEIAKNHKDIYQQLYDNSFPEALRPAVYFGVFDLYQIVLKGILVEKGSDTIINPCFLNMGNKMLKTALEKKSSSTSSIFQRARSPYLSKKQELLEEINKKNLTLEQAIEELSQRNDLTGKLVIQELIDNDVISRFQNEQSSLKEVVSPKINQSMQDALIAAHNDNWQETEKILSETEFSSEDHENESAKLSLKLMYAIATNQDWLIIESLLNQGGKLEDNTIFILAQKNNVNLASKLYHYNLNIHVIDPAQHNAIFHSVIFKAKEMISFLVSKGVDINLQTNGVDPLDQALTNIIYQEEMIDIIEVLIANGIKIENSHTERVSSFKTSNSKIYDILIKKFPQLKA